jgi:arylsulfatase A-like enzyme
MVDAVVRLAEGHAQSSQPFFIWAHLFDAHIPYSFGAGRSWARNAGLWLAQTGHDHSDIDPLTGFGPRPRTPPEMHAWSACYDAAIAFIDAQIGRLEAELRTRGLEDTVLVLASDHGEELGEHGDTSHRFRLYEHNTRVHLSVHHPDIAETTVPGLCTLMDLAPTVAASVGVKSPPQWEGRRLDDLRALPRDQVTLETFFGSPCDPVEKPIYLATRRGEWKLLWCDRTDEADHLSVAGAQLFDLSRDPNEMTNLAPFRPQEIASMMPEIQARAREIEGEFSVVRRVSAAR